LVQAATFGQMRASAAAQAPDPSGILKDPAAFFRRGYSGAGHEELRPAELARYYGRTRRLAPPDLLDWLHRGQGGVAGDSGTGGPALSAGDGRMESAVAG
jgi:aryl sulfotransferase